MNKELNANFNLDFFKHDAVFNEKKSILKNKGSLIWNKEKIQFESKILGKITTEIKMLDNFYFAEDYHQQYLAKNPNGYCSMKGTGVSCAV